MALTPVVAAGLGLVGISKTHCASEEGGVAAAAGEAAAAGGTGASTSSSKDDAAVAAADGKDDSETNELVDQVMEVAGPVLMRVGSGGVAGFVAAYALKQVGKMGAFVVGCAFIGLQTLQYFHFVDVHYDKMLDATVKAIDTDGDNQITTKDLKVYGRKLVSMLKFNLPSSGGFGAGFLLGLRA
eukprot:g5464.t1